MNGTIILEQYNNILIKEIRVQDENLFKFLNNVEEERRIYYLIKIMRIGVIGLKRMEIGEEIDYVEKEFNFMTKKFGEMLNPDLKNSHVGKLLCILEAYFEKGGTIECLFDLNVEDSPLAKLRKEIREEFKELRDIIKMEEAREDLILETPIKGYKFEEICEKILSGFVSKHIGDILEDTTIEIGELSRSFAGDFLITLRDNPNNKIVIETKDKGNLTLPSIIKNLKEAMENRKAKYGIFVSKFKESFPRKIGWFNEYEGNMLVCALGSKEANSIFPEILNIAYQWAKLRLKSKTTLNEEAIDTIIEGIKEINAKLNRFSQIKTQCTNINKAAKEIRNLSDGLREDIKEHIKQMQTSIEMVS